MPENVSLEEVIRTSTVVVHEGRFAYLRTRQAPQVPCFMVSRDMDEITVIAEEKQIPEIPHEKAEKWFKLLEVRVSMPFVAKGFLAKISKTIAEQGLNILIVSTFSKDYALVREETYQSALEALKGVGFPIRGWAVSN